MIRLKTKLALFNLASKLAFTSVFLLLLPYIIERINLRQIDRDLIRKREQVIDLISRTGIEPFITSDSTDAFGSFNILKEEFISLERTRQDENLNYIEVTGRIIDDEEIEYRVLNYSFLVDGQMYLLEIGKSLSSIQNARKEISRIILVFLGVIILFTLITDLQYTHFVLRPLDKITGKLKGISSPSLFDKSPVRTSTLDFFRLDQALRELMDNIDSLFRKEKEITVNISHELLTPVSVIRSRLENLLLEKDLTPDIAEKIEESLKTLHRLQMLVNSLLMIARIESHQYLREDNVSVKELLAEVADEIKPVAEDKGILMKEVMENDLLFQNANRSLLFSMFYNVLTNAVKNTSQDGEIRMRTFFVDKRFIATVEDTGKGMTEEQKSVLFQRFKSGSINSENGTGIGLAIAKSIADFHDIEIKVSSDPGKGSAFSFIFPEIS